MLTCINYAFALLWMAHCLLRMSNNYVKNKQTNNKSTFGKPHIFTQLFYILTQNTWTTALTLQNISSVLQDQEKYGEALEQR